MGRIAAIAGPMSLPVLSEPPHASDVIDLARAIQLSLAPVFLLSAITALLGVISTRLARVIERAQELQTQVGEHTDLAPLRRRMRLLTWAIETVSITGILVASVVAVTFISAVTVIDLAAIVVPLFVLAMLTLMAALLMLLLDSRLASRQIRHRF